MRDDVIKKRKYAETIAGDALSLEISSYAVTADYLSNRLATSGKTICELCSGIGISLIEFSQSFDRVIGVDNDPAVLNYAKKNLEEAAVKNCELIIGNVDDPSVLQGIDADIVAYDIPYWSDHQGTVTNKNPDLKTLIELIRSHISENIVVYAPPHIPRDAFYEIADEFEFQEVWVDGRHDRNFIYLGSLIDKAAPKSLSLYSRSLSE